MKLEEAEAIAERLKTRLGPHCERIEIAGSIRRRKPEVGDIELVCIPCTLSVPDLFGTAQEVRYPTWSMEVAKIGRILKGDAAKGRYVQAETPEGIKVDIFTATRDNWGLIFAIRTGSADYSHYVLACGWTANGYKSADGMLTRHGAAVPVREEKDLFALCSIPWTEPENRNNKGGRASNEA